MGRMTAAHLVAAPSVRAGKGTALSVRVEESAAGLCLTCNNAANCTYRARRGFDALFCEMFDDYVPTPNGKKANRNEQPTQAASRKAAKPAQLYAKGLCSTCENRDCCAFPRPEGGIWHCEEFR